MWFQLPRNPQQSSELMQLPSELRLKILRCLVKVLTPIAPVWIHDRRQLRPDFRNLYNWSKGLSSQILQVCQRLNEEGECILYMKNPLLLSFQQHEWEVLDAQCEVPGSVTELAAISQRGTDLQSIAARGYGRLLSQLYKSISKFENLRLAFSVNSREGLFILCHTVESLVRGKCVTFAPTTATEPVCSSSNRPKCCLNLRCRSVVFESIPKSISAPITSIVTGTACTENLFSAWAKITNEVITPLVQLDSTFKHRHKDKMNILKRALFGHNTPALYNLRAKLLAHVI